MSKIDDFLNDLSAYESNPTTFNPYELDLCRFNLKAYITGMKQSGSNVLIVGEAPGYKGCRHTGVPFTSEYIFKEAFDLMSSIFPENPFQAVGTHKEPSATIVWNGFNEIDVFPIMWNAFPFHPHDEDDTESNRTPTSLELEIGKTYLQKYIELFERDLQIWAIGKKAQGTLRSISIEAEYIRHPANGGKSQFLDGLRRIKSLEM